MSSDKSASIHCFRKRQSDMLREQHMGSNRLQRLHDTRRTESCDLRRRGHGRHYNLFVHSRPLSVANNDVVGHLRFLSIQVRREIIFFCDNYYYDNIRRSEGTGIRVVIVYVFSSPKIKFIIIDFS